MNDIFSKVKQRFAFSDAELYSYAQTAPHRYKTYYIPKRASRKKREISQPSRDLKAIQRFILSDFLLEKMPFSNHATAYRSGKCITDNATPHLSKRYLLKLDFSDFFPSITGPDFQLYLLRERILQNKDQANMMTRIFFKDVDGELRLTIGSPGSPAISNALLKKFDDSVSSLIGKRSISYTRYSDDLTFSTNEKGLLFSFHDELIDLIERTDRPHLIVNQRKTVFSSTKFNRHVTGITIANDGKMSLGRSRKRGLRTQVYEAATSSPHELASLRGYLAFARQVEPDFIEALWRKYPDQMKIINNAFGSPKRPRSDQ